VGKQKVTGHPVYEEREEHPAYGMASLHRISSTGSILFGSSVKHHTVIALTVKTAEKVRGLHSERGFGRDMLLELFLSPTQLIDMLTNMNMGDGVPCTLRHYRADDGAWINAEDPPHSHPAKKTYDEFVGQTAKAAAKIREMQERLKKLAEEGKPVGKKALTELALDMGVAAQEIDSNMPFIMDSFREDCEHVVKDAKGEVEAFITGLIQRTGLKALAEAAPELPMLSFEEKDDEQG